MGLFQKFFSRTRTSRWLKRETESERRARAGESSNDSADKALGVAVSNLTNEHHTFIRIECRDRVGLLCDVATHLTRSGVNVVQADVMPGQSKGAVHAVRVRGGFEV